jgi:hypothetical protein
MSDRDVLEFSADDSQWHNSPRLTQLEASVPRVLWTRVTSVQVVNTTTATNLVNQSITGGTLGTKGALVLECAGHAKQNNGTGNQTLQFAVKYGATTLYTWTVTMGDSAAWLPWHIRARLTAANASNAQRLSGVLVGPSIAYFQVFGLYVAEQVSQAARGTATEDSTAAKNLTLTAQWGQAHANMDLISDTADIMHIPGV